jgi:hypothetical protein
MKLLGKYVSDTETGTSCTLTPATSVAGMIGGSVTVPKGGEHSVGSLLR